MSLTSLNAGSEYSFISQVHHLGVVGTELHDLKLQGAQYLVKRADDSPTVDDCTFTVIYRYVVMQFKNTPVDNHSRFNNFRNCKNIYIFTILLFYLISSRIQNVNVASI